MRTACNRRTLVAAFTAVLAAFGLLGGPFGNRCAGTVEPASGGRRPADARRCRPALSRRSRLLRPGTPSGRTRRGRPRLDPEESLRGRPRPSCCFLRPEVPGLELFGGFVLNRSNGGDNVAGVEYMASIAGYRSRGRSSGCLPATPKRRSRSPGIPTAHSSRFRRTANCFPRSRRSSPSSPRTTSCSPQATSSRKTHCWRSGKPKRRV